jgi:hypothetical protein
MRVEQDGGRLRLIDIDADVNSILARPVFDVESVAAHAQCGVRANHEDRTRSRTLSDFIAAHASVEVALVLDGDRAARACPRAAQRPGEGRAGARTRRRRGVTTMSIGRAWFRAWLSARRSPPRRTDRKRCASPWSGILPGLVARVKCRAI